jgi:hypothetical protein
VGRVLFGCLHVVGALIVVFIPLPAEYWSPIGDVAGAVDNRAVDDASQLAWEWAATGTSWRIHQDGRLPRAAPTCAEADVQATLLAPRPHLIAAFALPAAVTQSGETRTSPAWVDVAMGG